MVDEIREVFSGEAVIDGYQHSSDLRDRVERSQYQGAFFYGDYAQSIIRYAQVDASNNITAGPSDFAFNADGPVQMEMGPDGNLYYVSIVAGEIRKFIFTGPDMTPPTVTSPARLPAAPASPSIRPSRPPSPKACSLRPLTPPPSSWSANPREHQSPRTSLTVELTVLRLYFLRLPFRRAPPTR